MDDRRPTMDDRRWMTHDHPLRSSLFALRASFLLVLLLSAGCRSLPADDGSPGLRVLFVGNSLTYWNDLPAMLHHVLAAGGAAVDTIAAVAGPNYGLEDHWADGVALSTIRRGRWDVVVLQQGPSATEGRPSLLAYSARFAREIRAAGARPALYMVWPSVARAFDFDGVSDAYRAAADAVDGLLFPVGEAWRAAFRLDSTVALYGPDGFHPTLAGTYVAALVMGEQLGGIDLSTLASEVSTPSGPFRFRADLAALLREAAHEANTRYARP